jgi:hypothetical protein
MYDAAVRVASTSSTDAAEITVELSVAGFQVIESDGATAVREGGEPDQLSVVLSARPGAPVVLGVNASDPGEIAVSPAALRFTTTNWNSPQSLSVRAVDDVDDDSNRTATVVVSVDVAQSPDAFEPLADRTITVLTTDDDEPPGPRIVITETDGQTLVSEAGAHDSIMVALAAPTLSNVLIAVSSEDIREVQIESGALLTFTPSTWNVPQVVAVSGIDDFIPDGNRGVAVDFSVVSFLSANAYDGLSARVIVLNADNER